MFLVSTKIALVSHIFAMFVFVSGRCFVGQDERETIRNACSAAVSPVRAVSPLSDIINDLGHVCFILVKRYISERLLSGGVFG